MHSNHYKTTTLPGSSSGWTRSSELRSAWERFTVTGPSEMVTIIVTGELPAIVTLSVLLPENISSLDQIANRTNFLPD